MMDVPTDALVTQLSSDDAGKIVAAAKELVRRGAREAVVSMRSVFQTTALPGARNALAIALVDLDDPDAFELIVTALRRLDNHRGTLLYALGERDYDYTAILPLLVELVIDGNYEESMQALVLTGRIDARNDSEMYARCKARLREALPVARPDWRPFIADLLKSFD